jgi:hypothetical protein
LGAFFFGWRHPARHWALTAAAARRRLSHHCGSATPRSAGLPEGTRVCAQLRHVLAFGDAFFFGGRARGLLRTTFLLVIFSGVEVGGADVDDAFAGEGSAAVAGFAARAAPARAVAPEARAALASAFASFAACLASSLASAAAEDFRSRSAVYVLRSAWHVTVVDADAGGGSAERDGLTNTADHGTITQSANVGAGECGTQSK